MPPRSSFAPAVTSPNGVVVCSPTATALALDDFPDNGYFFRTVPSDSLQMTAISRRAQRTGGQNVSIAYLDDPYGRGLARTLADRITQTGALTIVSQVGFSGDQGDLSGPASLALSPTDDADQVPDVLIVLADSDDGGRFLTAVDEMVAADSIPQIIVNDAIRTARQAIASLDPAVRSQLIGIAPTSSATDEDGPEGAFAANAVDCLNLIALAVQDSGTDAPGEFKRKVAAVTVVGQPCETFEACDLLLSQNLQIDFIGASGNVELSGTTGDRIRASFDQFGFNADGTELPLDPIQLP